MPDLATLRPDDLAVLLRVSRRYVDEEIVATGRIGYVQVGPKTRRFTAEQVREFLDQHTVPARTTVEPLRLVRPAA